MSESSIGEPITTQIRIQEVVNEPGRIRLELTGIGLDGSPAYAFADFDADRLSEMLFPGIFGSVLDRILRASRASLDKSSTPVSVDRLDWAHSVGIFGADYADVRAAAFFITTLETGVVMEVLQHVADEAKRQASAGYGFAYVPTAPAASSEPGSPAHADAALPEDGVSNSIGTAGGVDTPLPERLPEDVSA